MFRKQKRYESVKEICFDKNKFLLLKPYRGNYSTIELFQNNINSIIIKKENNLLLQNIGNSANFWWANFLTEIKSIRIEKKGKKILEKNFFFIEELNDNRILVSSNDNKLCCYDEIKDKFIWKQEFSSTRIYVENEKIYCIPSFAVKGNHIITCLNAKTGKILWNYEENIGYTIDELASISKYISPKIQRLLGVYGDILYLGIRKETLVGINLITGKECFRQELESTSKHSYSFSSEQMYLDGNNELIIGLSGTHYWEVAPKNNTIENWNLKEEFEKRKINCPIGPKMYLIGNYIYFLSDYTEFDGSSTKKLVAFNRLTKNIDWDYAFDFKSGNFITKFSATKNNLVVFDWEGNLYLFEKID